MQLLIGNTKRLNSTRKQTNLLYILLLFFFLYSLVFSSIMLVGEFESITYLHSSLVELRIHSLLLQNRKKQRFKV